MIIIDLSNNRKGKQQGMGLGNNRDIMTVIKYLISTLGILWMGSEMLSATRGTVIVDSMFNLYQEKIAGDILNRDKGSLLAFGDNMVKLFG